MRVADFNFELPEARIALSPVSPRDEARLLVVGDHLEDRLMRDLPDCLRAGDVLVFNNTRVIPASLKGVRTGRAGTTPKIEILLHQSCGGADWKAFARPAKKLEPGDRVLFTGDTGATLGAQVTHKGEAGEITLAFDVDGAELEAAIGAVGHMPLPPYIARKRAPDASDAENYQTLYATRTGAVAAPTAGLHFTQNLMNRMEALGVTREFVTLHVGAGTFLPVKADDTRDHHMHGEWGEITREVSARLKAARAQGRRIIAVGTTSLRLLEASGLEPFAESTEIFITPGYQFRSVDGLITNFHLPRSTLFMLVCAFAGTERMKAAYAHAIAQGYRFYSYGDGSFLTPHTEATSNPQP